MPAKAENIRNMTEQEIESKIASLQEELFKLRFEKKSGRVEKPHKIREIRRDIARCSTILREKENAKK